MSAAPSVESGKTSAVDKAAHHVRRLIDLRRVRPGDQLPSAAEISQKSGVNRMAVLAALQILQSEGLVSVKSGRAGTRVLGRSERTPTQLLTRAMKAQEGLIQLGGLIRSMEAGMVRYAVENGISEAGRRRARLAIAGMLEAENRDDYVAHETDFYDVISEAAHCNFLSVMHGPLRAVHLVGLDVIDFDRAVWCQHARGYKKLLTAIEAKRSAQAAELAFQLSGDSIDKSLAAIASAARRV